jgi:hypothetical protein
MILKELVCLILTAIKDNLELEFNVKLVLELISDDHFYILLLLEVYMKITIDTSIFSFCLIAQFSYLLLLERGLRFI